MKIRWFLLVCSFYILSVAQSQEVVLTVPEITGTMQMDGALTEKQWNNALVLENFFRSSSVEQAQEQTQVKILHDRKFLYFFFTLSEFALNPTSNQLKSFQARLYGENQKVWLDDCAEIRLAGADGKILYFGFNPNGATKNMGFASYQLKTKKINGAWLAELALELPAEKQFRFGITRFEKRLPEKSSYLPIPDDCHDKLSGMATLHLGTHDTPGVRTPEWGRLKQLFPVLQLGQETDCNWSLITNGIRRSGSFSALNGKRIRLRPDSNTVGAVDFFGELSVNGRILFRSPVYSFGEAAVNPADFGLQQEQLNPNRITDLQLPGIKGDTLYLSENGSYPVFWYPLNLQNFALADVGKQLTLQLLLPDCMEVISAESKVSYPEGFAPFRWEPEQNQYKVSRGERLKIGDEVFQRFQISRNTPLVRLAMPFSHQNIRERAILSFRAKPKSANQTGRFYYYCGSENFTEAPRAFRFRILPEISVEQPKNTVLFLNTTFLGDLTAIEPFLQTIAKAGVNEIFMDSALDVQSYGLKLMSFFNMERFPWRRGYPDFAEMMRKYPELAAVNSAGKRTDAVSFTYLVDHEEIHDEFFRAITAILKKFPGMDRIFWDFEFDPFHGLYADYSPAALGRFRQELKLGDSEPLTSEIIKRKYREQWIKFRTGELGRVARLLKKAADKAGLELVFYSDYDAPEAIAMYGLDWKNIADSISVAYMGYGRNQQTIKNTKAKLPGIKLVFGVLTCSGSGEIQRSLLLRRILDSRGGVLCWYEKAFSALELTEIAAVAKILKQWEPIILNGERMQETPQVRGTLPGNVIHLADEKQKLLILLNESETSETVSFSYPETLFLEENNRKYPPQETITISVPAGKFQIFSTELKQNQISSTLTEGKTK